MKRKTLGTTFNAEEAKLFDLIMKGYTRTHPAPPDLVRRHTAFTTLCKKAQELWQTAEERERLRNERPT
jgi:hypothetical protein